MISIQVKGGVCDGYPAPTIPYEGEWGLYLAPILLMGIGARFSCVLRLVMGMIVGHGVCTCQRLRGEMGLLLADWVGAYWALY
jgi:hypothetical protein